MCEAVLASKCKWDNEQERSMKNISGENHHWVTEEVNGKIKNKSRSQGKNCEDGRKDK